MLIDIDNPLVRRNLSEAAYWILTGSPELEVKPLKTEKEPEPVQYAHWIQTRYERYPGCPMPVMICSDCGYMVNNIRIPVSTVVSEWDYCSLSRKIQKSCTQNTKNIEKRFTRGKKL